MGSDYTGEYGIRVYVDYKFNTDTNNRTWTLDAAMYVDIPSGTRVSSLGDYLGSYLNSVTFIGSTPAMTGPETYTIKDWVQVDSGSYNDDGTSSTRTIRWKWGVNSSGLSLVGPGDSFDVTPPKIAKKIVNPTLSSLSITDVTATTAKVSYTITNNGGRDITHTVIGIKEGSYTGSVDRYVSTTLSGKVCSATLTGLKPNTSYSLFGFATNHPDGQGRNDYSYDTYEWGSFTTKQEPPGAPRNVRYNAERYTINSSPTVSWDPPEDGGPVTEYEVVLTRNNAVELTDTTHRSTTNTYYAYSGTMSGYGFQEGDFCVTRVRAVNDGGSTSMWNEPPFPRVIGTPNPPVNVTLSCNTPDPTIMSEITASWDHNPEGYPVYKYELELCKLVSPDDPSQSGVVVHPFDNVTGTSFTFRPCDYGYSVGDSLYFQVRAVNIAGASENGQPGTYLTLESELYPPYTPTITEGTPRIDTVNSTSHSTISFEWSVDVDETHPVNSYSIWYEIKRGGATSSPEKFSHIELNNEDGTNLLDETEIKRFGAIDLNYVKYEDGSDLQIDDIVFVYVTVENEKGKTDSASVHPDGLTLKANEIGPIPYLSLAIKDASNREYSLKWQNPSHLGVNNITRAKIWIENTIGEQVTSYTIHDGPLPPEYNIVDKICTRDFTLEDVMSMDLNDSTKEGTSLVAKIQMYSEYYGEDIWNEEKQEFEDGIHAVYVSNTNAYGEEDPVSSETVVVCSLSPPITPKVYYGQDGVEGSGWSNIVNPTTSPMIGYNSCTSIWWDNGVPKDPNSIYRPLIESATFSLYRNDTEFYDVDVLTERLHTVDFTDPRLRQFDPGDSVKGVLVLENSAGTTEVTIFEETISDSLTITRDTSDNIVDISTIAPTAVSILCDEPSYYSNFAIEYSGPAADQYILKLYKNNEISLGEMTLPGTAKADEYTSIRHAFKFDELGVLRTSIKDNDRIYAKVTAVSVDPCGEYHSEETRSSTEIVINYLESGPIFNVSIDGKDYSLCDGYISVDGSPFFRISRDVLTLVYVGMPVPNYLLSSDGKRLRTATGSYLSIE